MRSIHGIALEASVDAQVIPGEDARTRLTHLEQAISKVSALRHITAEYGQDEERTGALDSDVLPEAVVPRAWLWRQDMIDRLEMSSGVRQV